MSRIFAIFERPLKVFIVFNRNFKTAFEIPMSIFMNKNTVIVV